MEEDSWSKKAMYFLDVLGDNFKSTQDFINAVKEKANKLKNTTEKINFIKKVIIDLKNRQLNSNGDYTLQWKIRDLVPVLEKLEEIKQLESGLPEELPESANETATTFIIKGKLTEPEIERYFMQLTNIHSDYPNSKGEKICVLTKGGVIILLRGLNGKRKIDTSDFSQQQMRIFIYRFRTLHKSSENTVKDFVKFMTDNFESFSGLTEEVEYTNFNKGKVKLYPPYDSF